VLGSGWRTCTLAPHAALPRIRRATDGALLASSHSPPRRSDRQPSSRHPRNPVALMRYVRFLKTPRIIVDKGSSRDEVFSLITITSDLGDSFLPYDVQLSAELLTSEPSEKTVVWRTVQWVGGMRSLAIVLPVPKSHSSASFRVRIGVNPKAAYDDYGALSNRGSRGVVSIWSARFSLSVDTPKLVERRCKSLHEEPLRRILTLDLPYS